MKTNRLCVIATTTASLCFLCRPSLFAESLSLEEALIQARKSNGIIASAFKNYEMARSSVAQANSAFFPTVTPQYRFVDQKQTFAGGFTGTGVLNFHQVSVSANWLVLDAGQRNFTLSRSRRLADASLNSTLWTLRQTLFIVASQFYNVLRTRELLKVAEAQEQRAKQVLEITEAQVEIGLVAQKEVLQAKADLANAVVQVMTVKNQVTTAEAGLKASIGWNLEKPLPELEPPPEPRVHEEVESLEELIQDGLSKRPDLMDSRLRADAERFNVMLAERQASLDWVLRLDYTRNFEPTNTDNRSLTFIMSFPLFDGGFGREVVRRAKLQQDSSNILLEQHLRDARSEIESAYLTFLQNGQVLIASQAAVEAARLNFQAATESQAAGVSSIAEVTNARVALITAETNHVDAVYTYYISELYLMLVTGESLPGEKL